MAAHLRVLILTLLLAPEALSQLPAPAPAPEPGVERIVPVTAVPDAELEQRLQSVLNKIDDFRKVRVDVDSGVVRLSGTELRPKVREEVESLVSRFEGVVYIDNELGEETNVEGRLRPAVTKLREMSRRAVRLLPVIGIALVIVGLFAGMAHVAGRWESPWRWFRMRPLLRELVQRLAATAIFVIGLLFALEILDATAAAGAILGVAGLAGLAVSFAFRDIVENYLAGMLLSVRQHFAVGDLLRIEDAEGKVVRLTAREMVLLTLDGNHLRIPNSTVFKSIICNYTRNPKRRFGFTIAIGVNENIPRAQRIGVRSLAALKGVLREPEPAAWVEELAASSVAIRFFGWVDQREADFLKVRSEAIRLVKAALDEAGIEMPEAIHQVWLRRRRAEESTPRQERETAPEAEAEASKAEVSPGTEIEEQIRKELAESEEPNLLDDGDPR